MTDIDDDYDDYHDDAWDEPDEPDWGADDLYAGRYRPPIGRERRRIARRLRHDRREQRKVIRHDNDRFWQARNRPAFDNGPPF